MDLKEKLSQLSKEQIEWIAFGLVASIVLFIVVVTFFVKPAITSKKKLVTQLIEASDEIRSDERMAARKDRFTQQVKELKEQLKQMTEDLPQSTGSFSVLSIINKEAQRGGIVFDRIEPKAMEENPAKKFKEYDAKDFLLSFKAGYHQLGEFVNRLEKVSSYIQVDDINISGSTGNSNLHNVRMVIRCLTFASK